MLCGTASGDLSASYGVFTCPVWAWHRAITLSPVISGPMCSLKHCRTSPPRFLAECRMRRLNQASFVLLYFVLFLFSFVASFSTLISLLVGSFDL